MLLRNKNVYLEKLQIDVVRDVRRRFRMTRDNDTNCDGFFFEHDERLFGLGSDSGAVHLLIDGQLLKLAPSIETQLVECPDVNTFIVTQNGCQLCRVEYEPKRGCGLWVPNEDDECVDGFLWMRNVLRSPERIAIMLA
jgi:hypothetical protein